MTQFALIQSITYLWLLLFLLAPQALNARVNGKHDSPNAAVCRQLVNNNYDALIEQMQSRGSSSRSILSVEEQGRRADLLACEKIAKQQHFLILEKAYQRLNRVLEIYRQNGVVTEQQHQALSRDYQAVKALPKSATTSPYLLKSDIPGPYFRIYEDYLRYKASAPEVTQMHVEGQPLQRCTDEQGNVSFSDRSCLSGGSELQRTQQSKLTANSAFCRELAEQAKKAKLRYQQAVSMLLAMVPDSVTSLPDWKAEEISRSEAISDYKFHLTRAGWAGCPTAQADQTKPIQNRSLTHQPAQPGTKPFIDLSYAAGRLLHVAKNPVKPPGGTVTLLNDGSILQYGAGRHEHGLMFRSDYRQALQDERRSVARLTRHAWMWDAKQQSWQKIGQSVSCPEGGRLHHTATLLNDGKLLFAGGICDAQLNRKSNRYPAYSQLSLWDPETRVWLSVPALQQSRLYHTASLLQDGSVLIVGGEADPGVVLLPIEPVTNSVERYIEGRVETMPALNLARAKHSATVMQNGCVLVSGGFDSNSQPISEVEQWCPGDQLWRLMPKLRTARYDHSATLLDDGRVILAGGRGIDEHTLNTTEIWEPKQSRWSVGPRLPMALYRHSAIRLSDGRIMIGGGTWESATPWVWVWDTKADYWILAGNVIPQIAWNKFEQLNLFALDNGAALLITNREIMRWQPLSASQKISTPVWRKLPAAIELSDGRVMMVGPEFGDPKSGRHNARIWDRSTDRWKYAGSPGIPFLDHTNLIELGSGEVLYLASDTRHQFYCNLWQPNSTKWQSCSSLHPEHKSSWPPELALLDDGRVIALINEHEAYVYAQSEDVWHKFQVKWDTQDLYQGSPVRASTPLAVVANSELGEAFVINDLASRMLWPRRTSAYAMLWDEQKQHWSYILSAGEMGLDSQLLPDGCAISSMPLRLFNPQSGHVIKLPDPGLGLSSETKMLVLKDGGVIFVGVPVGASDPGNGFFYGKASCAGVTRSSLSNEPNPNGLGESKQVSQAKQKFISLDSIEKRVSNQEIDGKETSLAAELSQLDRFFMLMEGYKTWLFIITVSLVGMALLHYFGVPYLPTVPKWLMRSAIYTLLALYLVPPVWHHLSRNTDKQFSLSSPYQFNEQACWEDPKACIDQQTGLLVNRKGESKIPCYLVGDWTLRQKRNQYRIRFKDDGTYVMTNSFSGNGKRGGYHGYWAVQGNYLVWRHFSGGHEFDINKIVPQDDQTFKVVEMNGSETVYELIKLHESTICSQVAW
ncbi:MAG: kelch repeat-containing protein [Candidatus Thiodiazotropha sp.]